MKDPLLGWKILTDILNPCGIMGIGIYSEIARQDVVTARSFIENKGYPSTIEGIRECRKHIFQLPDDNPIKALSSTMDFYATSSCRDLIFHVQEHRFTLLQISEIIEYLDLELIGFEQKNPGVLKLYSNKFPDDVNATSMINWHQFELENPQTYIGMYNLWLRKKQK